MDAKQRATKFMQFVQANAQHPEVRGASLTTDQYLHPHPSVRFSGIQIALGVLQAKWRVELQVNGTSCSQLAYEHLKSHANKIEAAFGCSLEWDGGRANSIRKNVQHYGSGGYNSPETEWLNICKDMDDAYSRFVTAFSPFLGAAATIGGTSRIEDKATVSN